MLFDKKKNEFIPINPYSEFANYYDDFMDHIPYKSWVNYLHQRAVEILGRKPDHILDVGCGTGTMLSRFDSVNASLTGIDQSIEMIARARQNFGQKANWIQANIIDDIPIPDHSQDFAYSSHDSLNYILTKEQLYTHFVDMKRVLEPAGVYSVDFVTLENINNNYDGKIRSHRLKDGVLRWGNSFDKKKNILKSRLEFSRHQNKSLLTETHYQKYYSRDQILSISRDAGFKLHFLEADYSIKKPGANNSFWNFHFQSA